jgi:hypothetical protein
LVSGCAVFQDGYYNGSLYNGILHFGQDQKVSLACANNNNLYIANHAGIIDSNSVKSCSGTAVIN